MKAGEALLGVALLSPPALLLACVSRRARQRIPALLALAPLPALAAALFGVEGTELAVGSGHLRVRFVLDLPGRALLGTAALLWSAAGAYAARYLRDTPHLERFCVCWLLAMTGCLGAFVVADMVGFYTLLALLSVGSCGLVVHTETPRAWRSGGMYLAFALVGESALLLGLVLLASAVPGGAHSMRDAAAALPALPQRDLIIGLLIAGLGLKAGLVPLHSWIPLAHAAAPIPASAVLSGTAVKIGVIGLIRLLPIGLVLPAWGVALATAGLFGALCGVAIGLTQAHPKAVLAYSTVSQMGLVLAVLGMGLVSGDPTALPSAAFYATHHVLVKGALFLAVGIVAVLGGHRARVFVLVNAVLALALGGLPLTGGGLAKFAVKGLLGDGLAAAIATLSSAGTTLLMLHFLRLLLSMPASKPRAKASLGLGVPWFVAAAGSIAVPWALYLIVPSSLKDVLAAAVLWEALWPMLIGAALGIILAGWQRRLPAVPEGDVVVVIERAARRVIDGSEIVERAGATLRSWPVAVLALLVLAVMLGAATVAEGVLP